MLNSLIRSKKGGEFKASTWFIAIAIYYIFFILAVYSAENISLGASTQGLTNTSLDSINLQGTIGTYYCDNPRFYYNANTGEKLEYSNAENDRLFCEQSEGVFSSSACNSINGCTWTNSTGGFWNWWTGTEVENLCLGDINASSYGIEIADGFIGRPRVASHDNTGSWSTYTPFSDPSPCNHPNVQYNKTLCNMFSCSWEKISADTTLTGAGDIYSTIGQLFTFSYDFGFENQGINYLVTFLFVILPLLILLLAIYFMAPVIH